MTFRAFLRGAFDYLTLLSTSELGGTVKSMYKGGYIRPGTSKGHTEGTCVSAAIYDVHLDDGSGSVRVVTKPEYSDDIPVQGEVHIVVRKRRFLPWFPLVFYGLELQDGGEVPVIDVTQETVAELQKMCPPKSE